MRVVFDTNTLVSGIIGIGPPRRLVEAAIAQRFPIYTSDQLLAELLDVLARSKFSSRLKLAELTPEGITADFRRIAVLVKPVVVPRIVLDDPDDDHVIACALVAGADLIITGDSHLLKLARFQDVRIVKPTDAVSIIGI